MPSLVSDLRRLLPFIACALVLMAALFVATPTMAAQPVPGTMAESTKDQTAIKQAVHAYFLWQYTAQQEGVSAARAGQPAASLPEAQALLQHKSDLLEVAEYSNTLYDVVIQEQSFTLDYLRISANDQGKPGSVVVEVAESYQRMYAGNPEPAYGNNDIHRLVLAGSGQHWEVVADAMLNATDAPPARIDKIALMAAIRQEAEARRAAEQQAWLAAGITPEYLTQQREELSKLGLAADEVEAQLLTKVDAIMNATLGQGNTSTPTDLLVTNNYNRTNAKWYMFDWWNRRNSAWGNFDGIGGDCTNYVSQIINAGGVPEDKAGSYLWYWDNMSPPRSSPPYTRSASWAGVNELWSYIQGNSNNDGYNGPQGRWWTTSTGHSQMDSGDLIQLKYDGTWFHTYAVYRSQWVNGRFKVYISSHTRDRNNEDIDVAAPQYPTRRYVQIVGWRRP